MLSCSLSYQKLISYCCEMMEFLKSDSLCGYHSINTIFVCLFLNFFIFVFLLSLPLIVLPQRQDSQFLNELLSCFRFEESYYQRVSINFFTEKTIPAKLSKVKFEGISSSYVIQLKTPINESGSLTLIC